MLVGDPGRAEFVSSLLSEPRLVNSNRGLLAFTGSYGGARLSVATTGMGAPSAAIVLEELCNLGASIFIRVGSAGGLATGLGSGDIVVATAAVRDEGTSARYLKPTFPAVGDLELTGLVLDEARNEGLRVEAGLVLTHDAFYRGQSADELGSLRDAGVLAREMETSCVFVVSAFRRVRAASILAIGGNLLRPDERSPALFSQAEEKAVLLGLASLARAAGSL